MAELTLGAFFGTDGTPGLLAGVSDDGNTARSLSDGAPGTWEQAGNAFSFHESVGEVPPSPALPNGRIFFGVWNGIVYSDDKALTWHPTSAYGLARYIAYSFAWRPVAGHPYGGTLYSGLMNTNPAEGGGEGRGAEVQRSDDGGLNWTLVHRFTMAEMGLPPDPNYLDVSRPILFVTPDGAIWAGVSRTQGPRPRGGIMRSADGGETWQRAGDGFGDAAGGGYAVNQFALARDGRLYAATSYSVWRTTASVVGTESGPAEASGLGVSVRPNPAAGRVEVRLTLDAAAAARVSVVDALGREVALVLDGAMPAGETVASVETAAWPIGLYVVRAASGARHVSARLIVTR